MHSGVTVLVAKLWLDRSASPIGNDTHQVAPRQRPERSGLGAPECETGESKTHQERRAGFGHRNQRPACSYGVEAGAGEVGFEAV